jgi:protein-S-isoprenylcysteine O-methyltransferase Ste14
MNDLNKRAFGGLLRFPIVLAVFIFVPAGTLDYWQGWIFLAVLSTSVAAVTLYLMKNDPKLLERRMKAGPGAEKETSQKIIQIIAAAAFAASVVASALDHRFGWSAIPPAIVIAGDVLVALGMLIVFLVFKENTFTSGIIEVDVGQTVIATGPYALVRHPMYTGGIVMFLGIPLALGSLWGLLTVIPATLVIVWRLVEEEKFLARSLPGYSEYRRKVKYRLVPFIW